MRHYLYLFLCTCVLAACGNPDTANTDAPESTSDTPAVESENTAEVEVHPIVHGSVVLTQGDRTIFVDPYDGAERYTSYGPPDLVLITHTHGDHLDSATLAGLDLTQATLVAPAAVMEANPNTTFASTHALANGESWDWQDVTIEAIPAYNPPPKENFHPEGQFNGYVLDFAGPEERIYFSGDTEGVPAMRNLSDIDIAFVCMNLPYTMDIEQAADAVVDFAPSVVYPYHYRNQDGTKSDVEAFQTMVTDRNDDIEVRLENWYTER
ncbi:MBL fold metallo-hydrolase [Lewinella sp. IMCC34183]|uniref:MBL fold metallo-hydrolase n=1 Tax=Lewinella sp. IMCC34183 TaxID=2248762 RepID=UPI000E2778DA|nr:MBL fold metallo-hydrolase [Lewinella sp. IMCC34183]